MKATIDFILSEKEENAIRLLSMQMNESPEKLLSNTNLFLSLYEKFSSSDLKHKNYAKYQPLKDICDRIKNNESCSRPEDFFPEYYYSLTWTRFESIQDRNYDRILSDQFSEKVFLVFHTNWQWDYSKASFKDHEDYVMNELSQEKYAPNESWLHYEINLSAQEEIVKIYDDMLVVRFRNLLLKTWNTIYKKQLFALKKQYPAVFQKSFPFSEFVKFYGKSEDYDRTCIYCKLTESNIRELFQAKKIFTKRIYSRGITMEVDKKDPKKPYELSNLMMSCYWCNNAKTDEFSAEEFQEVAKALKEIWIKRLG